MKNNIYAIYLGCAGILAGGIGLAYDHSAGDSQAQEPLFVQAGLTPVPEPAPRQPEWQSGWPPANAAVAFHDEMVALLTPQTTQGTAARAQEPPQAAREVIREPATNQRQRTRTSRRRQVPDQTVGVGHDGDDESRAANSRGANRRDGRRGRERDEVDVIGRDGRSYRIERGDDDDAPPPGVRRYRGEREPPIERPRVMPDPFGLFGGGR